MNKKVLAKVTTLLMTLAMSTTAVACGGGSGGGSGDSAATEISVLAFQGTAGIDWIKSAGKRFAETKKDVSYQNGKKGVKVSVSQRESLVTESELPSDGNDIYIFENRPNVYAMSSNLMSLDDIVKGEDGLESKINEGVKGRLQVNGSYYALPSYEWYSCISYDVNFFKSKNLYFADSTETNVVEFASQFAQSSVFTNGIARFIGSENGKKTCGPNGIYGDYDDGLPSSLEEFAILCDYIKQNGRSPFVTCGGGSIYSFYLTDGLWASLAGAEEFNSIYTNYPENPLSLVKRDENNKCVFTSENLFGGVNGIYTPETEEVVLTDENGYRMYDMDEHYYGLAFLELIEKEGWFNQPLLTSGNSSTTDAQDAFLNPKATKNGAMLLDASYWYHEAEENALTKPSHNVSVMPLPVQLSGQVTEGKGKKQTLVDCGASVLFVNKKVETSGKKQVVLDFLKFLYSEQELKTFTETMGLMIPMDYDYDLSQMAQYYQNLETIEKNADIVNFNSDNLRFKKNQMSFTRYYNAHTFEYDGKSYANVGYLDAMRKSGLTAAQIFDALKKDQGAWNAMSK